MSYQPVKRHGETLNACAKWKKPVWEGGILWDSNCVAFEVTKYESSKKRSVVDRAGRRGKDK